MRKLIHFLTGSVRIRVTGAFPERFLNLCGTGNLSFWDVRSEADGGLLVSVPGYRLPLAEKLAERAGCRAEVASSAGLPHFLYGFRNRYALLAGAVLALLGAVFLSQFILCIDVEGNLTVPDSVILTELESAGFGIGSCGPGVDRRETANRVLLKLPELSFLSINISGVYARVVVREAAPAPPLEDRWSPGDVTAATDGVVVDMDALIGRPLVQEGQAVLKGEVLISGLETHERGDGSGQVLSTTQVRAEGDVWAMTERRLQACAALTGAKKRCTGGEQRLYGVKILKHAIKFYQNSSISGGTCDKIKNTYALTLPGGVELPLAVERITLREYETDTAALSRSSAEACLRNRLERELRGLIGEEGQILARSLTFDEAEGVLTARLEASCLEQIGRAVQSTNDNPGDEPH